MKKAIKLLVNVLLLLAYVIVLVNCPGPEHNENNVTASYAVGGTASGLTGAGLVLQNNDGDDLAISSNGTFTFSARIADGASYNVTVKTQPIGETCTASNNTGTISGADVTNVSVVCSTNAYSVGGTVSGLTGTGLVLQNNGSDDLPISGNGSFIFTAVVADSAGYNVTIKTQPTGETCTVNDGTGAVSGGNVTNVSVVCSTNTNLTYTVTYNGNGNTGGNVPVDSNYYQQGQTVTVRGNTGNLVKSGYTFAGWNTAANGSGTDYAASGAATFTMGSANVTLYAKWTTNPTYTVTYNGNGNTGGSVPVDTTHYPQGNPVYVLGNTGNLVKTGFTFAGWNTQADGSGTTYSQGQTFTMGSANVTLYAKWTANPTYTVTYNGNGNTGGSVPVDTTHYQQGGTVTVLGNTGNLVKSGYTFAGWNTQANGSGITYSQGQTFTMGSANVTLYARWTAPVPDTGQTTCYDSSWHSTACTGTGQDGAYSIHPMSFTDNGNGTITDNVTGLSWEKCSMGLSGTNCASGTAAIVTWADAGTACSYLNLAGTGWRLPTEFELMTIANYGRYSPAIDTTYFPNTQWSNLYYWSSTDYAIVPTKAWYISFFDGYAFYDVKTNTRYVRCVRGQPATFAESFTDNGNGTITDLTTNLTWQKCSYGQNNDSTCSGTAAAYEWAGALSYCEGLSLGGFTDWRLPNIKELKSVADMTSTGPNPKINITYFPNTQPSYYWSSTSYANSISISNAWEADFSTGATSDYYKGNTYYVRCVRGQ